MFEVYISNTAIAFSSEACFDVRTPLDVVIDMDCPIHTEEIAILVIHGQEMVREFQVHRLDVNQEILAECVKRDNRYRFNTRKLSISFRLKMFGISSQVSKLTGVLKTGIS